MIAQLKKAKRTKKKSAAQHTHDTVSYVLSDQGKHEGRIARVLKSDAFLHSKPDPKLAIAEMTDITCSNKRCLNPITHIVLSWSAEERPTPEQKEVAVRRIVHDLGADELAWLAIEHSGTSHEHMHLVINRVHPIETRVVHLDWVVKTSMKSVAHLNAEFGWKQEKGGAWEVVDGTVRRAKRSPDKASIRGGSLNTERWGDIEAPERVVQRAWDAAKSADSWETFHRTIAEYGLRYVPFKKGRVNGAIWELQRVKPDGTTFTEHRKASVIPSASWAKMQKKLGSYAPPSPEAERLVALLPAESPPHVKAEEEKRLLEQEAERQERFRQAAERAERFLQEQARKEDAKRLREQEERRERERKAREAEAKRRREREQAEAKRRQEQEEQRERGRYAAEIRALRAEAEAESEKRRPSSEALSATLRKLDEFERTWRGTQAWQDDEAHPSAGSTEFEFTKQMAQEWFQMALEKERRMAAIKAARTPTTERPAPVPQEPAYREPTPRLAPEGPESEDPGRYL